MKTIVTLAKHGCVARTFLSAGSGDIRWSSDCAVGSSLPYPLILINGPNFAVQTDGFGFLISWATNISVVVEACTDLANSIWTPVGPNTFTGGSSYFSDPQWTNYPTRFYRLVSPIP